MMLRVSTYNHLVHREFLIFGKCSTEPTSHRKSSFSDNWVLVVVLHSFLSIRLFDFSCFILLHIAEKRSSSGDS
ncbi:hypothetical protein L596_019396 [Steinernema carpocapsae]|uniref:Uncharacterized protein n=1 Tax=Steinernema carpocapsae TaxID=34508 RepID=A0A4U5MRA0_STECR|nr:hypothetical protein L596_019396 [Steinernema carpocapsae]